MIDERFSWITGDFIVKLVKNICSSEKIIIDSVHIENLLPEGETTFCELKRITIQYNTGFGLSRKCSFIQKTKPCDTLDEYQTEENIQKISQDRDYVFDTEIEIYAKLTKEIDHVLYSVDPRSSSIYPRYIYFDNRDDII